MARQRLGIAHVHHPLEEAERVEAFPATLITALHAEGQQRTEVGAQVSMGHRIEGIVGKPDIVHPINHGMSAEKFRDLARVLDVALHPQSQRLNALQEQKPVKRRQRGSSISLAYRSAARDECGFFVMIDVDYAVIGDLRPIEHIKLFWILAPGKLPAIHNHSADTGAAPSDEFRQGMYHYVGAV